MSSSSSDESYTHNNVNDSIALLLESKKDYSDKLIELLENPLFTTIKNIYSKAEDLCQQENTPTNILMVFQDELEKIPKWTDKQITNTYNSITKQSNCDYLNELIKVLYIIHIKTLSLVHHSNLNTRLNIRVPTGSQYIHACFIDLARELYRVPYLFSIQNISPYDIQKNMAEVRQIIKNSILHTLKRNLPIKDIVSKFLYTDTIKPPNKPLSPAKKLKTPGVSLSTPRPISVSPLPPSPDEEAADAMLPTEEDNGNDADPADTTQPTENNENNEDNDNNEATATTIQPTEEDKDEDNNGDEADPMQPIEEDDDNNGDEADPMQPTEEDDDNNDDEADPIQSIEEDENNEYKPGIQSIENNDLVSETDGDLELVPDNTVSEPDATSEPAATSELDATPELEDTKKHIVLKNEANIGNVDEVIPVLIEESSTLDSLLEASNNNNDVGNNNDEVNNSNGADSADSNSADSADSNSADSADSNNINRNFDELDELSEVDFGNIEIANSDISYNAHPNNMNNLFNVKKPIQKKLQKKFKFF